MAMNHSVLGNAIAQAIADELGTTKTQESVDTWTEVAEELIQHIINNMEITFNFSIDFPGEDWTGPTVNTIS